MLWCNNLCSSLLNNMYSCSTSMSWRNRVVDVEVHVRGAVEDLPLVRHALGSCDGRELRLMKVVPPPQPTPTSPLSFPTHPHLSPIPFDFYCSPSPSLNTALLHSPDKPHFPSPNPDETRLPSPDPDETRLPSPDPDETRLLTIDAYTPELFSSPTLPQLNFTPELFSSPASVTTPPFSALPHPLHCSTPVASRCRRPVRNLFPHPPTGSPH